MPERFPIINNFLKQNDKNKRDMPTSLIVYYKLVLCFGVDFGVENLFEKKFRHFFKIVSVTLSIFSISILSSPFVFEIIIFENIWQATIVLQYFLNFMIMFLSKYKVTNFVKDIHSIDVFNCDKDETRAVKVKFAYFMIAEIFSITSFIYFNRRINVAVVFWSKFISCVIQVSLYLIPLSQAFIAYLLRLRIKYLKKALSESKINLDRALKFYMQLADCYDKINPWYKKFVIASFCIDTPIIMTFSWYILHLSKNNVPYMVSICKIMEGFNMIMLVSIPPVYIQMLKLEIDSLVVVLHHEMAISTDGQKFSRLQRLLRYIEARRLTFNVWGVIPADLRIFFTMISVSTTYLIVLIQFTHLYD